MRLTNGSIALLAFLGGLLLDGPAQATAQQRVAAPAAATGAAVVSGGAVEGPSEAPAPMKAIDRAAIEDRWGIQIEGLHLTAGGYMLDFRYRVLDATKAAPLFDRATRPVLTDEKTGIVMAVPVPPKTGPLRSSNDPKEGRTYFMFFANPGHFIAKYNRVTVTIGEFRVSGLIVGS